MLGAPSSTVFWTKGDGWMEKFTKSHLMEAHVHRCGGHTKVTNKTSVLISVTPVLGHWQRFYYNICSCYIKCY